MIAILSKLLIGGCLGYLLATLSESWLHRVVGHASPKARKKWKSLSWFGMSLSKAHFGHAILHHGKTFKANHVTQFTSTSEKDALDAELIRAKNDEFLELHYGLVTSFIGTLQFVAIPAALCLCISFILFGSMNPAFLSGACLPIVSTPMLSNFIHPYLHLSLSRVDDTAPFIARIVIRSPYGRWVRIHHYVHHRHPQVNFNLLPGGDYLLGTYRKPTTEELTEMAQIGLLDDAHR